ncbi:MAG: uracil phosphoribosyltransferase [Acidimicrobiia bacterium]|nr:uracil phosphoribosyltransferase [Acidimicrobiia bacterium]
MSLTVVDNPITNHYLSILRSNQSNAETFRSAARRVSLSLVHEAAKGLVEETIEVETPLERTTGTKIAQGIVAVPVLRSGLGMIDAVLALLPDVSVGYVGVARDEITIKPEEYYIKLPDMAGKKVLVLEPMLATGGSLSYAIQMIKNRGGVDITAICVIAAPVGVDRVQKEHPDVDLVIASIDRDLNDHYYIRPGLGDMGDRLFGTV